MKKILFAITIIALLAVWATLAAAQPAKRYLITGGLGYAKLFDLTITAVNGESRDNDNPTPDGSITVGGGIFYNAMPQFAVGAEVSWLNLGTQTIDASDDSYSAIPVTGQVLYMIPTGSAATPFLTGGAGLYHLSNEVEGIDDPATSDSFGFNVGGGIKIETGKAVVFGVDVRFHMAVNPELTFELDSGDRTFETTDWKMLTVMGKLFF
jgi:opacity protein-like surface antigen